MQYARDPGPAQQKEMVQVVLAFDVIVFLRLTGVLQSLSHQLELLR